MAAAPPLGSDEVPPPALVADSNAPAEGEEATVLVVTFWQDGFQVEDGELLDYDSPILAEFQAGRFPESLPQFKSGQRFEVRLAQRMNEPYRPRSRSVNPQTPPRDAPPVPDQRQTTSTTQTVIDSPIEHNGQPPSSVVPTQEHDAEAEVNDTDPSPEPYTKSVATNPIQELQASDPEELTPLRAHYLKKCLIQLQFERELDAITTLNPHWPNVSTLSYLGSPFLPPPKDAPNIDMPFLRYTFRQFVLTFPFMASAPKDFYSQKLQPFVASMISHGMSSSSVLDDDLAENRGEKATRKKLLLKVERNLSLFLGAATRLVEKEEVVRLTQADLERLEILTKKRQAKLRKNVDLFEVNIVCVRTVTEKGRVRSRVHDEFVIRTRRSRYEDVYVSRRYGDFRTLANELTKAHPEESIRQPPPKDRSYVTVSSPTSTAPRPSFSSAESNIDPYDPRPLPEVPSRLAREKNRLTLRSYLHSLMTSSTLVSSPVLRSFLLSGPITLTQEEQEDVKRRENADRTREDGRKKFAKEIASRVDALRDAVKSVKGDIMGKDGLTHVFKTIRVTPDIRGLPPNYQAVVEWGRISLASTVFRQFVASDNASEAFAGLKRTHGLMPYFMLKTALKISNPIGMIRSVLDLFLAQPFGGKSLLQRMFTSSLTEEVKQLQEEIEATKDKVDDPIMCQKVQQFVYAPREIQEMFKTDSVSENMNIFVVILRSGEQPALSRPQMHRLARAHKAHVQYQKHLESLEDSDLDDGPEDEDGWLLEDLKVLAYLYTRLRDREMLIDLIFEGFTAELLKDIITIFYTPLAQVYRAASIADSLGDLQNFVNDLIKTVEQVEEMIQEDPNHTVQAFIDLIQRHEQSFYNFVHKVHSKGEGLFDSLMRWVELFLTIVREGLGEPLSLDFLLPHTGKDRTDILAEVDQVAMYHYKRKVVYEDKIRRRFGNAQGNGEVDLEDEATKTLVDSALGGLDFKGVVEGDALDIAAEESEESDEYSSTEEDDSGEETGSETSSEEHDDESGTPSSSRSSYSTPVPNVYAHPHHPKATSVAALPPSRTYTQTDLKGPLAAGSTTSVASTPPAQPQRKRSLSLKKMKSLTSLGSRRDDEAIPPVPSLPRTPKTAVPIVSIPPSLSSKPLPPNPSRASTDLHAGKNHLPRTPTHSGPSQQSRPRLRLPQKLSKSSTKKKGNLIKPPELEYIPKLLPVFIELMRPALQARPVSQ